MGTCSIKTPDFGLIWKAGEGNGTGKWGTREEKMLGRAKIKEPPEAMSSDHLQKGGGHKKQNQRMEVGHCAMEEPSESRLLQSCIKNSLLSRQKGSLGWWMGWSWGEKRKNKKNEWIKQRNGSSPKHSRIRLAKNDPSLQQKNRLYIKPKSICLKAENLIAPNLIQHFCWIHFIPLKSVFHKQQ